jgi:hypothetical protein
MTLIPRSIVWLLLATAPPVHATTSARGELDVGDGAPWRVVDTTTPAPTGATLTRRVNDGTGSLRYASRTVLRSERVTWTVEAGHPAQRVAVDITAGEVIARDPQGRERWRAVPDAPLCLPELVADLAVQADAQVAGKDGLACLVPIDKARKLAPLHLRRLPDAADGSRRYVLLPGSLGMRLFFSRQTFTVSADGRRLLAADGQFEVARSPDGRLRYVEGMLRYTAPRDIQVLPPALMGPVSPP